MLTVLSMYTCKCVMTGFVNDATRRWNRLEFIDYRSVPAEGLTNQNTNNQFNCKLQR